MSKDAPHLVQLATRIPFELHKKLKLHCVKEGESVMAFVQQAIEKALKGKS
jgi:predicted HicB family RNase H-like nuclease